MFRLGGYELEGSGGGCGVLGQQSVIIVGDVGGVVLSVLLFQEL